MDPYGEEPPRGRLADLVEEKTRVRASGGGEVGETLKIESQREEGVYSRESREQMCTTESWVVSRTASGPQAMTGRDVPWVGR